ncbi:hypothetical protein L1049_021777 [Liquidambar formosana]|uniref:Uncharacterized protein n=1 Tax=Liquidambar formosana TaxID=63359 RepID=A0AAP0RDE1_LIQFO
MMITFAATRACYPSQVRAMAAADARNLSTNHDMSSTAAFVTFSSKLVAFRDCPPYAMKAMTTSSLSLMTWTVSARATSVINLAMTSFSVV